MVESSYAARAMAFLAWLDTVERVDYLLLEMRHVQETIASQLHIKGRPNAPANILYRPLLFEDHYLWGRYSQSTVPGCVKPIDWFDILDPDAGHLPSLSRSSSILAALWCPQYPSSADQPTFYETLLNDVDIGRYERWFDRDGHSKLSKSLRRVRVGVSTDNRFSANDDRLYEALRHLQLIKRDMLRDKLVLAYRALETFSPKRRDYLGPLVARFLVVRRAALHSLHMRLDAFNDIVTTVEETLNLSMERDPPPTVRRRRDQGIYTTDLADNCNFIARDITDFFTALVSAKHGSGPALDVESELDFIIHRYTRQYTSTYRYDHIWNNALDGGRPLPAGFVQSSFWMPERTDLQPIIAHEIAHLLIRHYYRDLTPFVLDSTVDPFGRLLRQIAYVFESYEPRLKYYDFSPRVREQLAREIACDLIAVAVHRTSHIFAEFLDLISSGSEKLFVPFPNGDIAQKVERIGAEYITLIRDLRPEWLTRLTLSIEFSRALLQDDSSRLKYLENFLHDGVESVIDAARHEHAHWMDGDQREDWDTWFEMTCVLRRVVAASDLVDATAKWLWERMKQANAESDGASLNRYVPPLPREIVEACLGAWLDRLVERPRMLATYLDETIPKPAALTYPDILQGFRKLYLGVRPGLSVSRDRHPESRLFNHLIDIPWQTAILAAHDFLGDPAALSAGRKGAPESLGVSPATWLSGMHEFNWLGSDLYHAALEYVVWFERPPIGRLKAMNRWLISIGKLVDDLKKDRPTDQLLVSLRATLDALLGPDADDFDDDSDQYKAQIEALKARFDALRRVAKPGFDWPVADIGSRRISRFHPHHNREIAIEPSARKEWTWLFDGMAMSHMNYAADTITASLVRFFDDAAHAGLVDAIAAALERPIPEEKRVSGNAAERGDATPQPQTADGDEENIHARYGRIVLELIRVAHYLEIRHERTPGERATAHHAGRGFKNWHSVFSEYLDVPIHARKMKADAPAGTAPETPEERERRTISQLVPSRSIRVDRFSQVYDAPAGGHRPGGIIRVRGPLFWVPWDAKGIRPDSAQQATFKRTGLQAPLLGRFDRITLDVAKHTARSGQYFPSTPYFRRQQIGVPFAAQRDGERISRADSHEGLSRLLQTFQADDDRGPSREKLAVPLATISILLVQRSARLTFVERLLAEDLVARSLSGKKLSSPFRYFNPQQDIGLLTDGWGDIFLVLFAPPAHYQARDFDTYVKQCDDIRTRFHEIITLRKSIFEDTLVVRSETSYTPLAIDTALLRPDLFRSTILVRFRSTRDGISLSDEFERHLEVLFSKKEQIVYKGETKEVGIGDVLTYSRISGRIDYQISTKQRSKDETDLTQAIYRSICGTYRCEYHDRYGVIFEMLRKLIFAEGLIEDHVDMTATAIAEMKFPMH